MPFRSQAQRRLIYAKEAAGELPKGTAAHWASVTHGKLPEHVKKSEDLAKSRPSFAFPGLGIGRHEHNIQTISTPRQQKIADHRLGHESGTEPELTDLNVAGQTAKTGFARSPTYFDKFREAGLPLAPYTNKSLNGTTHHEAQHAAFAEVGHRYGLKGKRALINHMIKGLPENTFKHLVEHTKSLGYDPDDSDAFNEEIIANTISHLNDPETRAMTTNLMMLTPNEEMAHDDHNRIAYKHFQRQAGTAVPALFQNRRKAPMAKAQTPFAMPKLGVKDTTRQIPITNPAQTDLKQKLIAHATARKSPGASFPDRYKKVLQTYQGTHNRAAVASPLPDAPKLGYIKQETHEPGIENHENWHATLNQVHSKYGPAARKNLSTNLIESIPDAKTRDTVRNLRKRYFPNPGVHPDAPISPKTHHVGAAKGNHPDEEAIGYLFSHLNDEDHRKKFFDNLQAGTGRPITDDMRRGFDTRLKSAAKHMRRMAEQADESWLSENKFRPNGGQ
jgi:hypothetical protein